LATGVDRPEPGIAVEIDRDPADMMYAPDDILYFRMGSEQVDGTLQV
jgi:hypothetical protein